MTRHRLSLWITLVTFALLTPSAYGQTLTLTGEQLHSTTAEGSITCVNGSQSGTLRFTGIATGPYPGQFTEVIQLTPLGGGLVSPEITFEIVSGTVPGAEDILIQGKKTPPFPQFTLPCDFTTYSIGATWNYTATIEGPNGALNDSGLVQSGWSVVLGDAISAAEIFLSSTGGIILRITPDFAINPVATSHTVTAFVENAQLSPVAGVTVYFTVEGSVTTSGTCVTTSSSGSCSFTYNGPTQPGADLITAFADVNGNGQQDPTEFPDTATKAWVFSTPLPGSVTGGGQAGNPAITFGFNARTSPRLSGTCTVVDQSTDPRTLVKCTTVTNVLVIPSPNGGGTAHVEGTGTINGTPMNYQIDVVDVSEPNQGADQFRISTSSGYTAGGAVTSGNIQVHR